MFGLLYSVRVSNELGYGRPRTAQLAVIAVVVTSLLIGLLSTTLLLVYKKQYPIYFTTSQQVKQLVEELTLLLGGSTIVTSMQSVLSGRVAIGAGWQTTVSYLNIVSYIGLGIPLGLLLGFKFDMGVKGIWYGMVSGASTQCCLLLMMIWRTNWNNEVNFAEDRIKQWGGTDIRGKADDEERTS
ncbi:putative multi antimicrobial extrusion protein [Helianthus anomalus]